MLHATIPHNHHKGLTVEDQLQENQTTSSLVKMLGHIFHFVNHGEHFLEELQQPDTTPIPDFSLQLFATVFIPLLIFIPIVEKLVHHTQGEPIFELLLQRIRGLRAPPSC